MFSFFSVNMNKDVESPQSTEIPINSGIKD